MLKYTKDFFHKHRMTAIKTYSCETHKRLPAVILVGNKCDVSDEERKISFSRGKSLADKLGVPFFETSAKSEPGGINVRVCVNRMAS